VQAIFFWCRFLINMSSLMSQCLKGQCLSSTPTPTPPCTLTRSTPSPLPHRQAKASRVVHNSMEVLLTTQLPVRSSTSSTSRRQQVRPPASRFMDTSANKHRWFLELSMSCDYASGSSGAPEVVFPRRGQQSGRRPVSSGALVLCVVVLCVHDCVCVTQRRPQPRPSTWPTSPNSSRCILPWPPPLPP